MLSARDVSGVTFPVVKWREGYEIDGVQELLDALRRTLEAYETGRIPTDGLTASRLKHVNVQPTKFREGWERWAVDKFFREARDAFAAYEGVPR